MTHGWTTVRRAAGGWMLAVVTLCGATGCGEKADDGPPPGVSPASARLGSAAVDHYLSRHELDTPAVRQGVLAALDQGKTYRARVRDRMNRPTRAVVSLDRANVLVISTTRKETCPDCKGSGSRDTPFEQLEKVAVEFRCLKCKGEGSLDRFTVERRYVLGPDDFDDPVHARQYLRDAALADAPKETAAWIERSVADAPRERVTALVWLDQHYVREGMFFQDLQPLLAKARQRESNERVMVWQFRAGTGDPKLAARAHYRIYADARTGKVTRKGFFGDN